MPTFPFVFLREHSLSRIFYRRAPDGVVPLAGERTRPEITRARTGNRTRDRHARGPPVMGRRLFRTPSSYSVKRSRAHTGYFVINAKEESFRSRPASAEHRRDCLVLRVISIRSLVLKLTRSWEETRGIWGTRTLSSTIKKKFFYLLYRSFLLSLFSTFSRFSCGRFALSKNRHGFQKNGR